MAIFLGSSRIMFFRFLLAGGVNTAVTYGVYLIFLQVASYQVSYAIAYVFGILLAYLLNLLFVFKAKSSLQKVFRYPLIYLVQYILGAVLLFVFVSVLDLSNIIAPIIVIASLLPVTFFMNKKILEDN